MLTARAFADEEAIETLIFEGGMRLLGYRSARAFADEEAPSKKRARLTMLPEPGLGKKL